MSLEVWAGLKAAVVWSAKTRLSLRAAGHAEPLSVLIRVGAMVTLLHHRGKLKGREYGPSFSHTHSRARVPGKQQHPLPGPWTSTPYTGQSEKLQGRQELAARRLGQEEYGSSPVGLLRATAGSQGSSENAPVMVNKVALCPSLRNPFSSPPSSDLHI